MEEDTEKQNKIQIKSLTMMEELSSESGHILFSPYLDSTSL